MSDQSALGLRHFDDRVGEGSGQPRFDSNGEEALLRVQPAVSIALGNRPPESPGTLYVTNRKVVWLSDTDKTKGYAVDFVSVSLHAVSRDTENYPYPCLYAHIETGQAEDDVSDAEISDTVQLARVNEMRLIPSDPSLLETLFDVFCESAELNPDPNPGQEGQNGWFFGDEQMASDGLDVEFPWQFSDGLANPIGHSNGNYELADAVHELQVDDEIFEDAEEGEPER